MSHQSLHAADVGGTYSQSFLIAALSILQVSSKLGHLALHEQDVMGCREQTRCLLSACHCFGRLHHPNIHLRYTHQIKSSPRLVDLVNLTFIGSDACVCVCVPACSQIWARVIQGCRGPCLGVLLCREEASDRACSTRDAATDGACTEPEGDTHTQCLKDWLPNNSLILYESEELICKQIKESNYVIMVNHINQNQLTMFSRVNITWMSSVKNLNQMVMVCQMN